MDRALRSAKRNAIVITTHSVYSYRTSEGDQGACLRAALEILPEGRGRHHKAVLKAFGLGQHSGDFWPSWAHAPALNTTTLKPLAPLLQRYRDGERGMQSDMRAAVQDVRRLVGRRALPDPGLVIIDEAHNLKSTSSAIYRSLMGVLDQHFDALLFLTATPFQLGRHELLTIIDFFKASRLHKQNPTAFADQRQALSDAMDDHVDALKRFGEAWRDLSVNRLRRRGRRSPATRPRVRSADRRCRGRLPRIRRGQGRVAAGDAAVRRPVGPRRATITRPAASRMSSSPSRLVFPSRWSIGCSSRSCRRDEPSSRQR